MPRAVKVRWSTPFEWWLIERYTVQKRGSGTSIGGTSIVQRRRTRRSRKTLYAYCTIGLSVCKSLITKEIVVEATGVELFRVLITRNLLILGTATTAQKAPLPDPLYVYCTKMLFALESNGHT